MAVFAGVWRRSGSGDSPAMPELFASLNAPYHTVLSAYDDDGLVLAAKSLEHAGVVSRAGVVAALSGRLDGDRTVTHVLDEYLEEKYGGLDNLSGDYAVVVYDAARGMLILMRDAVGTQPLYYYETDEGFAFGSQIRAVLAAAGAVPRPNHTALAELLIGRGALPRGATCFAGVHAVMPGHAVVVTRDAVSGVRHTELRPIVPTPLKTFEQSAAAFRRALIESVERRISRDRNTAVLVSGGVDSAAILCAAAAVADPKRILAISYGCSDGSSADERRHLNALLASTAVRDVRLDLAPIGFAQHVDANVRASEMPVPDTVPGTLERAAAAARADGAVNLLIGTWGDQLLFPFPPPHVLRVLLHGQFREYLQLARALPRWLADVPAAQVRSALLRQVVRGIVPPKLLSRFRKQTNEYASYLDRLHVDSTPRRRELTSHGAALRREVCGEASVDAMEGTTKWGWSQGVEAQLPFLDADLVQLLFAIPGEHALNDGVPKALLRRGMTGLVPDEVLARRDKGDYTEQIDAALAAEQRECIDRLEGGRRFVSHGLMSDDCAQRTLARLQGRREIGSGVLPMLVGLDAWLRVFFESPDGARS